MGDDSKSVTYREPEAGYFDNRRLKKHAGVFSLWALGVGAVISGDFSGWNLGVGQAGFGGFLLAVIIITVMYVGLCFSIAEMSPALPHTGGAYSFARTALVRGVGTSRDWRKTWSTSSRLPWFATLLRRICRAFSAHRMLLSRYGGRVCTSSSWV